jgi:hypothetical protein
MDIVPFLIEKKLLEPTRKEPPRTSSDWLVWKSEQIASYISGYDGDQWACYIPHVVKIPIRNPADRRVFSYDEVSPIIQDYVDGFYPDAIEVTVTEEMKEAIFICVPNFIDGNTMYPKNPDGGDTINIMQAVSVFVPDIHMPAFDNFGSAYMSLRGKLSVYADPSWYGDFDWRGPTDGYNYSDPIIKFNIGPHKFSILVALRNGNILIEDEDCRSVVKIHIPILQEAVSDEPDVSHSYMIDEKSSFSELLEWIGDNLNQSGDAHGSQGVVVVIYNRYQEKVFIRFKYDADANLYLLFSNTPVFINRKHASVVISYHDMCMVCRAWNSFQPRSNSDYLRSRGQSNIPPFFRPFAELAKESHFLTKPNQLKSPLHQNLPTMPGAVVDIIGQYLCIGASSSDDPNGAKNSMSRPVAGPGLGTLSTLLLDKSLDLNLLDKICEFLYKR